MAFWDASAIVPLCCSQPATTRGRKLLGETRRMIVWWGTPVEAHSAFARLVREGHLTAAERTSAIRRLNQLRVSWDEILPSDKVRSKAEELFDDYNVRAADALQLAAALVWCRERPKRRPFVCFDERLGKVAEEVGFIVRS